MNTVANPSRNDGQSQGNVLVRFLSGLERVGNKLPHPFWLFILIAIAVLVLSWILASFKFSATSPADGEEIAVKSLLTKDGAARIITEAVPNFVNFPPLGIILVVMIGVAVAENSGLIFAAIRVIVTRVSAKWLTFTLALVGVTGSVASDAIYVVLIPLGAVIFKGAGRSPILGAIVAFGSASAGYNASLVVTASDPLLAGLTTSGANLLDENYVVSPISNYFFTAASAVVLAGLVTLITETLLVRTAATADAEPDEDSAGDEQISAAAEHKGLRNALIAFLILAVLITLALAVPSSPLRGEDQGVLNSPLIVGVAVVIGVIFLIVGTVYGATVGTITAPGDIPPLMAKGVKELGPIIVLFFAASQFIAYFKWSELGPVVAIKGAELIEKASLPPLILYAAVVVLVCVMNIFITSGSAQWALMAPVLVPMLMLLGTAPEVTQVLFRMGDSPTNVISPMSPYFALALGYLQKYKSSAGIGTLMSMTLPISITLLVGWFLFFMLWYALGIPLGPGVPVR
ncbi:AbgT family transporter [Brevibacterium yomogidense]|uniref:AbgT family transporter n=1 Tax=Brevibacterium yomogidense TaxID=946573 RepID=UPI0018DFEF49|nr:AbgT family transporter [Brevibacterium yomogidense]